MNHQCLLLPALCCALFLASLDAQDADKHEKASVATNSPNFIGHWVGWAYEKSGGNFPLRLHVTPGRYDDASLLITLDSPGAGAYGIELIDGQVRDNLLRCARQVNAETRNEYTARLEDGELIGECLRNGGVWYDFELSRSPAPVFPANERDAEDAKGVYRSDGGRLIQIASWPWNSRELMFHDLTSGNRKTAFASGKDQYLIGPEFGAVAEPATRLNFLRNHELEVTHLMLDRTRSQPLLLERVPIKRSAFRFDSDGTVLHGDLLLPTQAGQLTAIIILGGGSWRTRADTYEYGEAFAAMGFAALCFDKRGSGASQGSRPNDFDQIAADSVAALNQLRQDDRIHPDRVGFFGFSRGGWHAPLAALLSDHAAFVISLAGPSVSPKVQETTRRLNELRRYGASETEVESAQGYLDKMWHFAAVGDGWEEYASARKEIEARGWLDILGGAADPSEHNWNWSRLNSLYDPLPAISSLSCPTLALLGGADLNVTTEDNLDPWRDALEEAPTNTWEVRVLPRADHVYFLINEDGSRPRMHAYRESVPRLWPSMGEWVRKVLVTGAESNRRRHP